VVLCDQRENERSRPFRHVIVLPWEDLDPAVRNAFYETLWTMLAPKRLISHFALNGWWLYDRLKSEQRLIPWTLMCHGIDVFTIGESQDYTDFITQYCALSPHITFTAVSQYLANKLRNAGVPAEKITVVPNSVPNRFWQARKTNGFWDGSRALRILTVGRLIRWKGHHHLIEALSMLQTPEGRAANLTIVYGNWEAEKRALNTLIDEFGLAGRISFVPFIDFTTTPDYYSNFDLFVLPSTVSEEVFPKTETFGVALLEAIFAGLPVIATTAGGIPEVIGSPGPQARIVPHGSSTALAKAIAETLDNHRKVFCDNRVYAEDRRSRFSPAARLAAWESVEDWYLVPRRKIMHFCALGHGGAFGSTFNIHKKLLRRGANSWFVTRAQEIERMDRYVPNVIGLHPDASFDFRQAQPRSRPGFTIFSVDDYAISNERLLKLIQGSDIVNLAWIGQFLSVKNIAALSWSGVQLTLTIRDMNLISGGCHYFHGCEGWRHECTRCPQLSDSTEDDYPRHVLEAKKQSWNHEAITYIALSDHSHNILSQASLSKGCRIAKISNFVDTDDFHPEDPSIFISTHNIPHTGLKIGYLPSFNSFVKGHDQLVAALRALHRRQPGLSVTVVTASNDTLNWGDLPYTFIRVGALSNKAQLRLLYNSVDLVVVPSLEETFSNTAVEALAGGCRVVGFETGIMGELLTDERLGAVVPVGDIDAFADQLVKMSQTTGDRAYCARVAASRFNPDTQITKYQDLYDRLSQNKGVKQPRTGEAEEALQVLDVLMQRRKAAGALYLMRSMDTQLHQANDDIQRLNNDIQMIMNSTSWKITRPMRNLKLFLRNFL
jgi:glycosyltransferase involved in cell wall biosynthesis